MFAQYIEIAGVTLCFYTEHLLQISEPFQPFLISAVKNSWEIRFAPVASLPDFPNRTVYMHPEYVVCLENNHISVRCYLDKLDGGKPYAVSRIDPIARKVQIFYLPEKKKYFNEWSNSFFHIGWEQILVHEQRFVLHASCVQTPLGGILFSGVSGIGKSTQADLWCRYANGRLLNGDRPIIGRENNSWKAYGSPYAGSSKCYIKESCAIRAIVMLQQSSSCHIRKLNGSEAFRQIFSGTTVNSWDTEFVEQICNLETELINKIPVYELCCTPERDAVQLLWNTLERGT